MRALLNLWLERVLVTTVSERKAEDGVFGADCKQCDWSVSTRTREGALAEAKRHRRETGGHLVVVRGL